MYGCPWFGDIFSWAIPEEYKPIKSGLPIKRRYPRMATSVGHSTTAISWGYDQQHGSIWGFLGLVHKMGNLPSNSIHIDVYYVCLFIYIYIIFLLLSITIYLFVYLLTRFDKSIKQWETKCFKPSVFWACYCPPTHILVGMAKSM